MEVAGDVVTFATTGGTPTKPSAKVWTIEGAGAPTQLADLWAFEKTTNPDGKTSYGIQGLSKSCKKAIPKKKRPGIFPYKGIKESHPYATAVSGDTTYVADAAANAIFSISDGAVATAAVLPPVKVKVTKKLRMSFKLPKCVQGKTFKGEPVPTDVELGPDGNLYVTTLGGGLGEEMPLGAVYQVTPARPGRQDGRWPDDPGRHRDRARRHVLHLAALPGPGDDAGGRGRARGVRRGALPR